MENAILGTFAPIRPREILREDVLKPLNRSVDRLAKSLAVEAARLNDRARPAPDHSRHGAGLPA